MKEIYFSTKNVLFFFVSTGYEDLDSGLAGSGDEAFSQMANGQCSFQHEIRDVFAFWT